MSWPWTASPLRIEVTLKIDPATLVVIDTFVARLGGMTPAEAAIVTAQLNSAADRLQAITPEPK